MRVTVPSPLFATQTASPPIATAPGSGPTSIGSPAASPEPRSILLTVPSAALATQTALVPASIPPGLLPTCTWARTSRREGSISVTVPRGGLVTQTAPPATVMPAGRGPARIASPGSSEPRSMRRTLAVEELDAQRPPAPTARRSGAVRGGSWVQMRRPLSALTTRSEEHTSELQSQFHLVCRLLLEKKNNIYR